MYRDIINAPALECAVNTALEGFPDTLQSHQSQFRTYFRRAATGHNSVRQAKKRKSDPDWAVAKFNNGCTLYRFKEKESDELVDDIQDLLEDLGKVANIAANQQLSIAREAEALLRGMPHRRDDIWSFDEAVSKVIRRAQTAALRARRHEVLRPSAERTHGTFTGIMCGSLDQIMRIGREVRNCLIPSEQHWEEFIAGTVNIWSLRGPSGLVAVLKIIGTRVTEILGPENTTLASGAGPQYCMFLRSGWVGN